MFIRTSLPYLAPDPDPGGGAPAPVPPVAPVTPPAPTAVSAPPGPLAAPGARSTTRAPAPEAPEPMPGEPKWLGARLEQAKKQERKQLKVERRAIKAAGEEAKAMTERAAADVAAAKLAVDAILASVPEAERAMLQKAAGGSVQETLKAFAIWQGAKGIAPPPVVAPAVVAPVAPAAPGLPAPATTVASAPAPAPPSGAAAPEDHKSVYASLRETNPLLAAQYLQWHSTSIYPDKKLAWK